MEKKYKITKKRFLEWLLNDDEDRIYWGTRFLNDLVLYNEIAITTEELLRDYISYHYVEGNITNEQRVKMEFAAANYLQELKQLHIPVVVRQSEQLVCPRCNNEPLYNKYDDIVRCTMCEK